LAGAFVAGGEDMSPPLSHPTNTDAVTMNKHTQANSFFMGAF